MGLDYKISLRYWEFGNVFSTPHFFGFMAWLSFLLDITDLEELLNEQEGWRNGCVKAGSHFYACFVLCVGYMGMGPFILLVLKDGFILLVLTIYG